MAAIIATFGDCGSCGGNSMDLANGVCVDCWDRGYTAKSPRPKIKYIKLRTSSNHLISAPPKISIMGRPRKFNIGDHVAVNAWVSLHNAHKGVIVDTPKVGKSYRVLCECGVTRSWNASRLDLRG